ncbi:hypothetical protein U9M48_030938 [Paspalum notatum var. saurae]|uniref:Uncharacterized protein n=1 Tax=Paspalum notatum var. saurae TaxID=547442 RepID=A0AAQ3U5U4_PASNO
MDIERDLHMAEGEGDWSYSSNSRRQEIVIRETKPMIENAIKEVYTALLPKTLIIADLGCSAAQNTLIFISNVIRVIADQNKCSGDGHVEVQFFLNDLPGNDFNELFRLIQNFKRLGTTDEMAHVPPLYYILGLPDSYYNRLFPCESVHLFHSSYCLHWRSQQPEGLEAWRETYLNEDNIYITKTTTPAVVKKYQELFYKDFSLFLKLRYEELVYGGQMVLILCGRKDEDVYNGYLNQLFGLVARSLQNLVLKGLVEKKKVESFNLPVYGPSVVEVKDVVMESHLFKMDHIKLIETNWDPFDDSEGDEVKNSACSSTNITKLIRSLLKSLVVCHFGETILEPLFKEFTYLVAKHLEKEKTKAAIIAMSLKKE